MEQLLNDARRTIAREPTRGPLSDWPVVVALVGALIGGFAVLVALGLRGGRGRPQPVRRSSRTRRTSGRKSAGAKSKTAGASAKSSTGRRRSSRSTTRRTASEGRGAGEDADKSV